VILKANKIRVIVLETFFALSCLCLGCGNTSCWEITIIDGTGMFEDVHGVSGDSVYTVSSEKGAFRYNGSIWEQMAGSYISKGIFAFSPTNIYDGCTHFDGEKWSVVLPQACYPVTIKDIWASSESDIFAVSNDEYSNVTPESKIFHFDGNDWQEEPNTYKGLLQGIWGSSSTDVYAVGTVYGVQSIPYNGFVLHYNGQEWSMTEDNDYGLTGIIGFSPEDIFAVGLYGHIAHFDGNSWVEMQTPNIISLSGVWGASPSEVYAVGSGQVLFFDGTEWRIIRDQDSGYFSANIFLSIWGQSATDVFAVGYTYRNYYPVGVIARYTCPRPGMSNMP